METEIVSLAEDFAGGIAKAAACIQKGELVGIPTETVYGLAGSALFADAAQKIYSAKGRPSDNPLIVHVAFPEEAENIAYPTPLYYRLAKKFMPGPLTVILPKRDCIPDTVSGGLSTVAIRCPSHPAAHALIEKSGHPIAAPSGNRSGRPSPTTAAHMLADMAGRIPLILDGGPCSIGVESTVITIQGEDCTILRPGAITEKMLGTICRSVTISEAVIDPAKAGDKPSSPGMKYKHYAPNCKVILLQGEEEACIRYIQTYGKGRYGVLATEETRDCFPGAVVLSLGAASSEEEHAKRLFALLREADEKGVETLYARLPRPNGASLAYYNRIIRSAAGNVVCVE